MISDFRPLNSASKPLYSGFLTSDAAGTASPRDGRSGGRHFASPILAARLLWQSADASCMKSVHVLLANSDRRLNNLIEVAVRDVCYNQLEVECANTVRLDELLRSGRLGGFGLIFVAPTHLVSGPGRRAASVSLDEAARAIRTIKDHWPVPIIAVGVQPQDEMPLLETGADKVFGILFDRDEFRSEVRRVLNLSEPATEAESEPSRWSFATGLLRGLQKLRQT